MLDFSKNHFELFGLPVGFVIDTTELAERYRELQRVVHPDRFASATDQERRISLQQATRVNEAFEILRNPLRRAAYLLELHGEAGPAQPGAIADSAFLTEQLELREALAEVPHRPHPLAALDELKGQTQRLIKSLVGQLAVQFEDPTPDALVLARESVAKLQFLNKLYAEAEALEAALEDES
jgi:molecular chaperone HscB